MQTVVNHDHPGAGIMLLSQELTRLDVSPTGGLGSQYAELEGLLERAFGVSFTIVDGSSGEALDISPDQPPRDWGMRAELCRAVSSRGRLEFIDDEDPFLTLALPLRGLEGEELVAVATFVVRRVAEDENVSDAARLLNLEPDEARAWAREQTPWTAESLERLGDLVMDDSRMRERVRVLQKETGSLSVNLAATYEEISLLYRLTQNLKLSKSDEDLARGALEWMDEVVPAEGLAIHLLPLADSGKAGIHAARSQPALLSRGNCPLDVKTFPTLLAHLNPKSMHQPIVVNRPITEQAGWPYPEVRQLIAVALVEGEHTFGWLIAVNHNEDGEFGTVEASLLSSVATILGIHGGNIELYRQQSELLAGIVRALSSAIDAKDPYTCGHSDRVARVAVCLARALHCDAKTMETLYLAGQLHDIGKIGINDSVLRKAGKLSDAEYEHIKQHSEIGHRILEDLSKLEDVLPVVLHHHESWDGTGYPHRLDTELIPFTARIVAVADAFDAMSSDRPYRLGMPDEKVDQILREGAGRQWDPTVIDAFFCVRDEVRRISREKAQPS